VPIYPSIESVAASIQAAATGRATTLVAIDGGGGAGKTTLASKLCKHLGNCQIVAMDDFLMPKLVRGRLDNTSDTIGAYSDSTRLIDQVLQPISEGRDTTYQVYDWFADALGSWKNLKAQGIVIVEGVYAMRKNLLRFYNFKIWVETDKQTRLTRGLARDGQEAESFWVDIWMPEEDRYVETENPMIAADILIKG
jgi:uridine kinase